jgi:phenylpyruvate tautomerase PptA (4-oxalocrotonate tautomerase family)
MPMLEAYIPEGALTDEAEDKLLSDLTDLLIRHEGADPTSPVVRQLAWVTVVRPDKMFVAGAAPDAPHYRFITSVPEGQFNPERRAAMIKDVTEAVLDAEHSAYPRSADRVWVITAEIPEGSWGGSGRVRGLADIVGAALGNAEHGEAYAKATFAERRQAARAQLEAN